MWDDKTPSPITRARLLRLPPQLVYDELKEYGAYLDQNEWRSDNDLEQALYDRSDDLINLGLAQFGSSRKVTSLLYQQSLTGARDEDYCLAIRLAILGNPALARACRYVGSGAVVDRGELLRLAATARTARSDELTALLLNPGARELVSRLLNLGDPFDKVAPERLCWMLGVTAQNPCINRNDEDESWSDAPDLTAYHIQQGIWKLVQSLPNTEDAIEALYMLLDSLELRRVYIPDEDPTQAILRWRSVAISAEFEKQQASYRYTTLKYAEEFCCLAAALYGRWYDRSSKEARLDYIGVADSQDLVLRCAYYGHVGATVPYGEPPLTAGQMKQMYDKDGDAFTLAALCNTSVVRNPKTRAVFEDSKMLVARRVGECDDSPSSELCHLYARRYKEILGVELPTKRDDAPVSHELEALTRIESELASLASAIEQRLKIESAKMWWVLALLVLVLIVSWSLHI